MHSRLYLDCTLVCCVLVCLLHLVLPHARHMQATKLQEYSQGYSLLCANGKAVCSQARPDQPLCRVACCTSLRFVGSEYCSFSISHACHTVRFQIHADHDLWFKQFMSHLHFMQHHHQHYQVDTAEQQYHQLRLTQLHPLRHCSTVASLRHCSTVLSLFIFWCSERPASCEYQWQGGGRLPALLCH